jgi:hypothetical protein
MSFLIPLNHRGPSVSSNDNFLWREKNIFVMDNHRLALWSWFQVMQTGQRYNLFHIDAHPDMSESALKYFNHDLWTLSLEDYRNAWQADINMPLFRWDNYVEIFIRKYPGLVGHTMSATHHLGSAKGLLEEVKPFDLAKKLNEIFSGDKFINDLPWIMNLDLDYFFSATPEKLELFSEDYILSIAHSIKQGLTDGVIAVLTISLSPECCGSWEKAESMLKKFSSILNLTIVLN